MGSRQSVTNEIANRSESERKTHPAQAHFPGDVGLASNGASGFLSSFIQTVYEPGGRPSGGSRSAAAADAWGAACGQL